ncbi:hypothetical protein C8Q73DRAFT_715618 [Cubamyces lactineus]|nr:hypothetical protein C8Q73DRAFT_715618 [Cubamyces lactineus]
MSQMTHSLLDLAPELLLLILFELDAADLLVCRQVCKRFSCLYESPDIQYKCQLAFSAMVDGAAPGIPVADRLRALKEYQAAWETSPLTLHPESFGESNRALTSTEQTNTKWLPFNGPFVATQHGPELTLSRLSSSARGIQGRSWTLDLRDILLDPQCGASAVDQSLVAFAGMGRGNPRCFRCHLFTMASGEFLAANYSPITYGVDTAWYNTTRELAIYGEALLWSITSPPYSMVLLYNWKTGEFVRRFEQCNTNPMHAQFLTSDLLMVSMVDLYFIHIVDSNKLTSSPQGLPLAYILESPASGRYHMCCRSHMACESNAPEMVPLATFDHDPNAAVLVSLLVDRSANRDSRTNDRPTQYIHCISRDALLSRLNYPNLPATGTRRRVLHWDEWATPNHDSLLLCISTPSTFSLSCSGSRIAILFPPVYPFAALTHDIFVFDVHRWARTDKTSQEAQERAMRYFDLTGRVAQANPRSPPTSPGMPLVYHIVYKPVTIPSILVGESGIVKILADGVTFLREDFADGTLVLVECYMLSI